MQFPLQEIQRLNAIVDDHAESYIALVDCAARNVTLDTPINCTEKNYAV